LERLVKKLDLSKSQVYRLVEKKARQMFLPANLAAIALASDKDINPSRYATPEELAQIRNAPARVTSGATQPIAVALATRNKSASRKVRSGNKRGTSVFVVHGRDEKQRKSLFAFLRAIGLKPIEWRKAIEYSGSGTPYVGEILDAAFQKATAVVVLLTPDDEARLKPSLLKSTDPAYERDLTGQPRPNVLFEAGMAFGTHSDRTVLVQVGSMRPFSDVAGRHAVRLDNSPERRQELITKLRNCGCDVDESSGSDWVNEGDFSYP
jgi:predicted nucleotide-binding protein